MFPLLLLLLVLLLQLQTCFLEPLTITGDEVANSNAGVVVEAASANKRRLRYSRILTRWTVEVAETTNALKKVEARAIKAEY